jgi:RNA polymerase sigma-70 factor (ECF subfamily)
MHDENPDRAAVMLTLSGNSEAYGDIVRRYKDTVFNAIYSIVKNYHSAEDLTQETFIDGYIKLKSLGEPYNAGAWLVKIAKNKSCNYMTRSALKFEGELHEYIQDTKASTPENLLIEQQERRELRQAVGRLPELYRSVIELYYFDNYPQNKIAEMLEIPVGTVSRRLYDAKLKLKKELEKMGNTIKNVNFEAEVAKRIKSLKDYYHLNNFSMEGREKVVEEFIKFIDAMPESKLKHNAYAAAYEHSDKDNLKKQADKEAELGENAAVYVSIFWDKYANKSGDEQWLKAIDSEEGLAKVEKMENSGDAAGEMLFWRGVCNTRLKNFKEAKTDFEKAEKKLNRDNSYHPNAVAGIKAIDALETNSDKYLTGSLSVTGELYRLYDNKKRCDFVSQPGFSTDNILYPKNQFDSVYYYASDCGINHNRWFFDLNEGKHLGDDVCVSSFAMFADGPCVPFDEFEQ